MKLQTIKITATDKVSQNERGSIPPESARFCPFKLLQNYISLHKSYVHSHKQFFVFADRSPVKPFHLRNILKKLMIRANLDYRRYSWHGARAGGASDLLDMGVSVETIRKIGRWKSTSVYSYLKP